ncbi:ABC transporter permease [uncultured Ruminococcus sp.]|uniref:ABC transporter permease n=1 Tax=uncultured Ruminococcus sp. TaxID=165186 RepID=UPI0025925C0A|nr:FtsX-like permease family protein [uncultured Ruminococcus sp.]
MKNPLNRRLPRELKSEFGKYLVIFLFFIMVISLVSGFLVADTSLHTAYLDAFDKYNIEDGNFAYAEEASDDAIAAIEKDGKVKVYANFYKEEDTDDFESTFRAFGERNDIDKVCLLDGDMPKADTDVAIDRLYAKNHDLEIGDKFGVAGKDLTISGIVALSDYSTLYQNASDMMFDNDKFGVGVMTDAGFAALRENHLHYNYSWSYDTAPEDDAEAKDMAEDLMPILAENGMLTNFLPEYLNQAIIFAGDDMGSDMSMILAFLYIVIVILAFVFSITISNNITKEANVIGTLRASGYSRGEMVRHYLIMPMLVLLVAAVVGNVLGYTWLEQIFANQYLASYGLTTYEVLLNPQAFVLTTVIPLILLFIINFVMLTVKMRISPLQFIRRDLSKRKKKKAFRLNTKIPIMRRFQMRVIFQNFPNHVMIFFGVFFANFILMFGMILQPMLVHYQNTITDNVLSAYQYILKTPAETETDGAEKFCFGSLDTLPEKRSSESVSLYGVKPDSDYVKLHSSGKKVDISTAYAEKYGVEKGDTITLKDPYGSDKYKFEVGGIYDYPSTIAVFMEQDLFRQTFDYDSDYFNAYFSDQKIKDIDDALISTEITVDDLTKTSRQLIRSMGSMMNLFLVFGALMFVLILYLLSKIIIEKNAQSISMVKILGYNNREINRIYLHSTTIVVILCILITIPISSLVMKEVVEVVFFEYSGWITYYMPAVTYVEVAASGMICYAIVAFLLNRKVKKIPMSDALKNVE